MHFFCKRKPDFQKCSLSQLPVKKRLNRASLKCGDASAQFRDVCFVGWGCVGEVLGFKTNIRQSEMHKVDSGKKYLAQWVRHWHVSEERKTRIVWKGVGTVEGFCERCNEHYKKKWFVSLWNVMSEKMYSIWSSYIIVMAAETTKPSSVIILCTTLSSVFGQCLALKAISRSLFKLHFITNNLLVGGWISNK